MNIKNYELEEFQDTYNLHLNCMMLTTRNKIYECEKVILDGKCIYNEYDVQSKQKTGRWEHDSGHFANRWICSQCGYKFYFEKSEAKYCPNCGAKMESDNNDS